MRRGDAVVAKDTTRDEQADHTRQLGAGEALWPRPELGEGVVAVVEEPLLSSATQKLLEPAW